MKTVVVAVACGLAALGTAGCGLGANLGHRGGYDPADCFIVAKWLEPGPYGRFEEMPGAPAVWPAMGVVVAQGRIANQGAMAPATLFLLAAPDPTKLTRDQLACCARVAIPCHRDFTGVRWVRLKDGRTLFVFSFPCGGTAGDEVVIFSHHAFGDGEAQDHVFFEEFRGQSRLPVYFADTDGDGQKELLVATEETNGTGAADGPKVYRIIRLAGEGVKQIGTIQEKDALKLKGLDPLDSARL